MKVFDGEFKRKVGRMVKSFVTLVPISNASVFLRFKLFSLSASNVKSVKLLNGCKI